MRETRTYGSVRGARGDARPYRDQSPSQRNGMGIASPAFAGVAMTGDATV
jgi:hypothetical protein